MPSADECFVDFQYLHNWAKQFKISSYQIP